MSLLQKIESDLITALKSKDGLVLSTLRNAKTAIHNAEIAKRPAELTEDDVLEVLGREVKKLNDSIVDFERGGRADLVEGVKKEIEILGAYLPKGLSEEELRAIVKKVVETLKPAGPQDFGKVMGAAMKEAKGRASGDVVSKLVKEALQP
ncbi:MAG: GatB/YqeY domain-containing protein [Patescibacteria group bacterium]